MCISVCSGYKEGAVSLTPHPLLAQKGILPCIESFTALFSAQADKLQIDRGLRPISILVIPYIMSFSRTLRHKSTIQSRF